MQALAFAGFGLAIDERTSPREPETPIVYGSINNDDIDAITPLANDRGNAHRVEITGEPAHEFPSLLTRNRFDVLGCLTVDEWVTETDELIELGFSEKHLLGEPAAAQCYHDVKMSKGIKAMAKRTGPTNVVQAPKTPKEFGQSPRQDMQVKIKSNWFRRVILAEKPSVFSFEAEQQHCIGELVEVKTKRPDGEVINDSFVDQKLFNYLRLKRYATYSCRAERLEHMLKLAQKYHQDNKTIPETALQTNTVKITVQKATDQITDDFLLSEVSPEHDRRGRFTLDWFKSNFCPAR
jgi:hypothetical protein